MKNSVRTNIANALINYHYSDATQTTLDIISNSIDHAWKLYGGKVGLPTSEFIQEWVDNEDFAADFGEEFENDLIELFSEDIVQERLRIAKETFEHTYGFTPEFELSSSDVVQIIKHGELVNVGVFNILNLNDGKYKFRALSSRCNPNQTGTAIVKDGVITLYNEVYPDGHVNNQWCIEDFKVDGKQAYLPIAMWGEYPILIEL